VPSLPAPKTTTLRAAVVATRSDDGRPVFDGERRAEADCGDARRGDVSLVGVLRADVCGDGAADGGREKGETESLPPPLLPFASCLLPLAFTVR
jgi:hypothetical protein